MKKLLFAMLALMAGQCLYAQQKPNVVIIYADDLGYGDLSCYGATKIQTPHIDQLAREGIRFTNGHTTSATCTPSRFGLLTGRYPWRKSGTGVLPGDAAMIIPVDKPSLATMMQKAGYMTALVGKWHLGLGDGSTIDWNREVKPGPNEVGFHYSFCFPATADRVPTVFLEDHTVLGLDKNDPIEVNYKEKVGDDPTGKEHPELLKMASSPDHGHNNTIVNGIGRIGFMKGGHKARWTDEELAYAFTERAEKFIEDNRQRPFFLYFALSDIHVPRMPATAFKGKSGLGYRGDAILQMDWTVGRITRKLRQLGLEKNTIVIFSSDNGPVLDDGYVDEAVTMLNGHKQAGPLRGGKYSAFEGGTRVPWIVRWPATIKGGQTSNALISQIDLYASFARLTGQPLGADDAPDSFNMLNALTGKDPKGRSWLILQGGPLSLVQGNLKYITPADGPKLSRLVNIETGRNTEPQLYDLGKDIGEQHNIADQHPEKVKEMAAELERLKAANRTRK
ncbi:arylsulfatase [Chitinophaga alhagiae]|uniref:Arylsulfatase n=1 Tax=Chitinophaga alhagiae TaxID=2203219 RepID=A0ABM6WDQ5_9BACT|nr:sulfatase-like hydrolase/transferase [Chitinophaga alhagiae]AWO02043.1 arylsulfatase [Chitinophaga alhagiae]